MEFVRVKSDLVEPENFRGRYGIIVESPDHDWDIAVCFSAHPFDDSPEYSTYGFMRAEVIFLERFKSSCK